MTNAYLPKIDYVPENSFVGCKLEDIEIPSTVTVLEDSCFASCDFKEIVIPEYVKSIEKMAFACCKKLETIKFEASFVEKIDKEAFKQCNSLKSIYVPQGKKDYFKNLLPEKIGDYVVEYNTSIYY